MQYDVAIIGAGIAGFSTAARLQSAGLSTIVFESHGQPGGCAGFFRRCGFSFDVGATTLVDFEPGGVGGEMLEEIGMDPVRGEALPGYIAWLPDRCVTLHRDRRLWEIERLRAFGATTGHHRFSAATVAVGMATESLRSRTTALVDRRGSMGGWLGVRGDPCLALDARRFGLRYAGNHRQLGVPVAHGAFATSQIRPNASDTDAHFTRLADSQDVP